MLSISGIFSVTFSVVFAFVADVTTDEDRSAAYGLVSIVCISVCWHPCSMSQATDGGFCAELSMVQWALFVKIQEEILVGVGVCQIIRHGETHTSLFDMTSKAQKHLGENPRQEQNSEAKMKREGQHFKAELVS